jgi:hypothetical protein
MVDSYDARSGDPRERGYFERAELGIGTAGGYSDLVQGSSMYVVDVSRSLSRSGFARPQFKKVPRPLMVLEHFALLSLFEFFLK